MAFITPADLFKRFGEKEIRDAAVRLGPDGTPDLAGVDDRIEAGINDGCAVVLGYTGTLYTQAQLAGSDLAKGLACDIARAEINSRKASEIVTERDKLARAFLSKVADGKAFLVPPEAAPESTGGFPSLLAFDDGPTYSERALRQHDGATVNQGNGRRSGGLEGREPY